MKKSVLFIIVLLFVSVTMKSQLHIIPEVGVTILKQSDLKATVSPRLGAGLDFFFAEDKGLGVGSGLYFYQKKETFCVGTVYTQNGDQIPLFINEPMQRNDIDKLSYMHSNIRRTYLQLPILVKYKWELVNDLNLTLAAGPYIAYGISGKCKNNIQIYDRGEQNVSFVQPEFSPYDLYIYNRFEVGFTTKFSLEINHWNVNMNYETNLKRRNLYKDNLISLGIGYSFRIS